MAVDTEVAMGEGMEDTLEVMEVEGNLALLVKAVAQKAEEVALNQVVIVKVVATLIQVLIAY